MYCLKIMMFVLILLQYICLSEGQKLNFTVPKRISNAISIYYFYGPTLENRTVLKLEDGLSLSHQKNFDVNKTTVFFFHGFGESATNSSSYYVATAFLATNVSNIVSFDYSSLVENNLLVTYLSSVYNVAYIGEAIGEFFQKYFRYEQNLNYIRLVAFSLGCQVMAQAARTYGIGQIPRLTGLDPAGPLFIIPGVNHLDANDGRFVDIIHTDGGILGDGRTIGTVDFFPNQGHRVQPGCNDNLLNFLSSCSHSRSYMYYAESVRNPKAFLAEMCDRTFLFDYCCCNNKTTAYMGFNVSTRARGTYYLNTNSKSPYGEGKAGINL